MPTTAWISDVSGMEKLSVPSCAKAERVAMPSPKGSAFVDTATVVPADGGGSCHSSGLSFVMTAQWNCSCTVTPR